VRSLCYSLRFLRKSGTGYETALLFASLPAEKRDRQWDRCAKFDNCYSLFDIQYSLFDISYFLFPISYFLFSILHFLFSISHFPFPISHFPFTILYSLFVIRYSIFDILYFLFPIFHFLFSIFYSLIFYSLIFYSLFVIHYYSLRSWDRFVIRFAHETASLSSLSSLFTNYTLHCHCEWNEATLSLGAKQHYSLITGDPNPVNLLPQSLWPLISLASNPGFWRVSKKAII